MVKKDDSIEWVTEKVLSADELEGKIFKLEKEKEKNKKLIEQYKAREKSTARALILYERKIAYIKSTTIHEISSLCKKLQIEKNRYLQACENLMSSSTRNQFKGYAGVLDAYLDEFKKICEELELNSAISNPEREFIAGKNENDTETNEIKVEKETDDLSLRFAKLQKEFNEKVGQSVLRGRGRPKKAEQSIVSDIGLNKSGKNIQAHDDTMQKLNEIFYETPKSANVVSNIPNTPESLFDFDEALNPNLSLKDIMDDLMEKRPEGTEEKYFNHIEKNQTQSREERDLKRERIEKLEAGIFQTPIFKEKVINKTVPEPEPAKAPTFEDRFMPFKNIMDETRK